ncbi:MAG: DUF1684 domain-containing protein [Bacteroidia bacterium]|nr:DUF1684 domain-containing protein [Bacteroidia bacterium]
MRLFCTSLLCMLVLGYFAQSKSDSIINYIKTEHQNLQQFYLDSTTTPLSIEERKTFPGIHHFPIDLKYRVNATLKKFTNSDTVVFSTSSSKLKKYIKYAEAHFKIDNKKHVLILYRSVDLMKHPKYGNLVFLPFTDLTSNEETYGGGRYLDLEITDANTMLIDFNLCYQPYCAYSHNGWSCPIPPKENFVNAKILAGVKN